MEGAEGPRNEQQKIRKTSKLSGKPLYIISRVSTLLSNSDAQTEHFLISWIYMNFLFDHNKRAGFFKYFQNSWDFLYVNLRDKEMLRLAQKFVTKGVLKIA